jgi:hypothetical protein
MPFGHKMDKMATKKYVPTYSIARHSKISKFTQIGIFV